MIKVEMTTKQIEYSLKQYKNRVSDVSQPLTGFGNYYLQEIKKQFQSSTDPEGNRWADLMASTLREKQRRGSSSKPLIDKGSLQNSFSFVANKRSLVVQSSSPILRFHESGTSKMKARPVLGNRIPQRHIQKGLKLLRTWVKRPR